MARCRERLYSGLVRIATRPTDFFRIPPDRGIELGRSSWRRSGRYRPLGRPLRRGSPPTQIAILPLAAPLGPSLTRGIEHVEIFLGEDGVDLAQVGAQTEIVFTSLPVPADVASVRFGELAQTAPFARNGSAARGSDRARQGRVRPSANWPPCPCPSCRGR
jgi:hypothetical protein